VIVEYIRYALTAHSGEELTAAYQAAQAHLAAAPEAIGWELTRCAEDPSQFILRIEWTNAEDHLKGFRKGANFPPFLAEIRPFVGEIAEMRHYEPTGVASV
jgi:heme-degrading monooxygenase HmoA